MPLEILSSASNETKDGSFPMCLYALAHVYALLGEGNESAKTCRLAADANATYVFSQSTGGDSSSGGRDGAESVRCAGSLLLGESHVRQASSRRGIQLWERAAELDPQFPTTWRNLGFAYYNVRGDEEKALEAFARARNCSPPDARICMNKTNY